MVKVFISLSRVISLQMAGDYQSEKCTSEGEKDLALIGKLLYWLGWYKRCSMNVVNYILSPTLLETKIKDGAGLLNPLNYYLRKVGI